MPVSKPMRDEAILDADQMSEDSWQSVIRPRTLGEFVGQPEISRNLKIFIDAARQRGEPLDHVLFSGPPGLGKTTLAGIVAYELGYHFKQTSAPAISKAGDIAAILSDMDPWSVLFIDEIHRLPMTVEEMLYSAMEDFRLDFMIGEGPQAKTISLQLPPFTLVGATTRPGALSAPLRDRFGIDLRLEFYSIEDLGRILKAACLQRADRHDDSAIIEIAKRSRGTPRIAHRLLRRVRDFAMANDPNDPVVDIAATQDALSALGVDDNGLDRQDRRYLTTVLDAFGGGPVGVETLASSLNENVETFETLVEPYLLSRGFINRTPRGRVVTKAGKDAVKSRR